MTWRTGSLSLLSLAVMGLVLTGSARAQPSQALIEARPHMLNAEINTLTFRSMEKLFETLRVASAGDTWRLDEQPVSLDFVYTFGGETRPAEAFLERTYTNALLILKKDRIVFERYLNNTHQDDYFISMSAAKSITSILIGMAIDDGLIESVDDPTSGTFPSWRARGTTA